MNNIRILNFCKHNFFFAGHNYSNSNAESGESTDSFSDDKGHNVAIVELVAQIVSPGVQVVPKLDDVNEALLRVAKNILSTAKGISQWQKGCKTEVSCLPCFSSCLDVLLKQYMYIFTA